MLSDFHINFLEKNGKKEFAVIPFDEFCKIEEALNDYEDLLDLRLAKEKEENLPNLSMSEVKQSLGL